MSNPPSEDNKAHDDEADSPESKQLVEEDMSREKEREENNESYLTKEDKDQLKLSTNHFKFILSESEYKKLKNDINQLNAKKETDEQEERKKEEIKTLTTNKKNKSDSQSHRHEGKVSEDQSIRLKRIETTLKGIESKLKETDRRDITILSQINTMKAILGMKNSMELFQQILITSRLRDIQNSLNVQAKMIQPLSDLEDQSHKRQQEVIKRTAKPTGHGDCLCKDCLSRCQGNISDRDGHEAFHMRKGKTVHKKFEASGGNGSSDDPSSDDDKDNRNDRDGSEAFRMRTGKRFYKKFEASGGNGSSDDPSSDDDKDNRNDKDRARKGDWSNERNRKPSTPKDVKRKASSIDSEEWENCLHHKNFEHRAEQLLQKGKLPGKAVLDKICARYNRKSRIVQSICHDICVFIQQKSKRIVFVWAGYRYSKEETMTYGNEVVFAILTQEIENVDIDCDFEICQRSIHEIDGLSERENITTSEHEKTHCLTDEEKGQLKKCIAKHAKIYTNKHSNLTRITLSSVKSKTCGTQHDVQRVPCIAFYVQIKGLIPINEEPFTERIERFPVDVREGIFRLHGKPADFHKNVKMGCLFDTGYGTNQGTIGPFITIERDHAYYCLTSSHIVLAPSEFQRVKNKGTVYYGKSGIDVYQPPECLSYHSEQGKRYPFGRIEVAIYREGDYREAGMEIALLKINDDRLPSDCNFPDIPSNSEFGEIGTALSYDKICGLPNLTTGAEVCKYGGNTELTKGCVRFDGAAVKTRTFEYQGGHDLTLYRQIEVHASKKFGDQGDSGSLVLINVNNDLVAFGIFEGSILDGSNTIYIVTPLVDIIRALSETMPRTNPGHTDQEDMDIDSTVNTTPLAIRIPLKQDSHEGNRNRPNGGTEIGITRSAADLEENIMFNTEHKINIVKSEISTVEKKLSGQIQSLDSNMKSLFEEQNSRQEIFFKELFSKFALPQNPNEQNGQN